MNFNLKEDQLFGVIVLIYKELTNDSDIIIIIEVNFKRWAATNYLAKMAQMPTRKDMPMIQM